MGPDAFFEPVEDRAQVQVVGPTRIPPALRAASVPVVPAVGTRRALVVEGDAPWAPFPVREHAPVVPGCGSQVSD